MFETFDRRVIPEPILDFVRACQKRIPCHLGGGAALAGAYLGHRMTGDIDLFTHDAEDMRALVASLPEVGARIGVTVNVLRDVGHLVRARLEPLTGSPVELDIVHEPGADLAAPPPPIEGVVVESLTDLRASKLTCILSRSEPRDLVDLFFLDLAGYPPDQDLALALRKDAGIDPGVLAWLLAQFPIQPLPKMLEPLTADRLREYRDTLALRFRQQTFGASEDPEG